jgi:hypothetical protein
LLFKEDELNFFCLALEICLYKFVSGKLEKLKCCVFLREKRFPWTTVEKWGRMKKPAK